MKTKEFNLEEAKAGADEAMNLYTNEKQKDASKAIQAVDRIDKYIDETVANAHDMKDSSPDKKYYRGWDDALAEMSRILQDVYSGEKQKEKETIVPYIDFVIKPHNGDDNNPYDMRVSIWRHRLPYQ